MQICPVFYKQKHHFNRFVMLKRALKRPKHRLNYINKLKHDECEACNCHTYIWKQYAKKNQSLSPQATTRVQ